MEGFMWEEILKVSINYGLMSALFVSLLFWVLRDAKTRERKYQSMVDKLQNALAVVYDIQKTTKEIRDNLIKKEKRYVESVKKAAGKN